MSWTMRAGVRRVLVPVAVAAIAGVWTTGPASAKTITVKSGGSIQDAIDKAKEGDTISVAKGTYRENVEISQNQLTLTGKNATIVPPKQAHKGSYCWQKDTSSHSGICVAPEDFDFENFEPGEGTVTGVSVSGFTVKNFPGTGIIAFGAEDTKISDNTVTNNKEYGVAAFVSTRTVISGNTATAKKSEAGIYIGDSPDAQAEVSDNTSKGANDGIFIRNAENATFEGNTLTGNCNGVLVLGNAPGAAGNSTFSGNTITKNNKFCGGAGPRPRGSVSPWPAQPAWPWRATRSPTTSRRRRPTSPVGSWSSPSPSRVRPRHHRRATR